MLHPARARRRLDRQQIIVRGGKGDKDRIVMLPAVLVEPLAEQVRRVRHRHTLDLRRGGGFVPLADPLAKKTVDELPEGDLQLVKGLLTVVRTRGKDETFGDYMKNRPPFAERMKQAKRDIRVGRLTNWRDLRRV